MRTNFIEIKKILLDIKKVTAQKSSLLVAWTILNLYKMKFQEKTRGFAEQHKLASFFKYSNGVKRFLNNIYKWLTKFA